MEIEALDGKYRIDLELVDVPDSHLRLDGEQLDTSSSLGLVIRLENRLDRLEDIRGRGQEEIKQTLQELDRARAQLEVPFAHGAALVAARSQAARLAAELGELAEPKEHAQVENAGDGAGPAPRAPALGAIDEQRRSWMRRPVSASAEPAPPPPSRSGAGMDRS